MLKKVLLALIITSLLFFVIYLNRELFISFIFSPNESKIVQGVVLDNFKDDDKDIEVLADNLEIPWEIAFLPSGEILVTERPGRLIMIGQDRKVIDIKGVEHTGEGGLLGMALHPDFSDNQWIYLYFTSKVDKRLVNRVERYRLSDNQLLDRLVIIDNIPGAKYHDGGRIEFGPDGFLYITTGDAGVSDQAQNSKSLHGSILRVTDDGLIPQDNPFDSVLFSFGHRNVQGLAWDNNENLWSTEHGRSGIRSGFDELNLIKSGQNYGWPIIEGDKSQLGMVTPIIHSGEKETWAPGDVEFVNGKLFFVGLRGESLYEVTLNGEEVTGLKRHFTQEWGRLRAVRLGPDGYLYLTTSNRDGRGIVNDNDDKLIKINPEIFYTTQ